MSASPCWGSTARGPAPLSQALLWLALTLLCQALLGLDASLLWLAVHLLCQALLRLTVSLLCQALLKQTETAVPGSAVAGCESAVPGSAEADCVTAVPGSAVAGSETAPPGHAVTGPELAHLGVSAEGLDSTLHRVPDLLHHELLALLLHRGLHHGLSRPCYPDCGERLELVLMLLKNVHRLIHVTFEPTIALILSIHEENIAVTVQL